MKRKLLLAALCVVGVLGMRAQTDVTSTYLTNADFESSTAINNHVCGYQADATKNNTPYYWLQEVSGWTIGTDNVDNRAGAVFAYGTSSTAQLRGNQKGAPDKGPSEETEGNTLGLVAVWGGTAQYVQTAKTALPYGKYTLSVQVYNAGGTSSKPSKSLIGFITDDGREYFSEASTYTDGKWETATVTFSLLDDYTSGKFSIGYISGGEGSAKNPHFFFDDVTLLREDIVAPTLETKVETGGTSVSDYSDFNTGTGDFTLDVEGTVGTPIVIAAENINYTPTTSPYVRFVRKDGVVYVYEDGEFMRAIGSSKAKYTFATKLTEDDPITNNLLDNPSFETLGAALNVNDGKYKLGTPWTTNVTEATSGIRVNKGNAEHGEYVLVWRGSGNNNYFTQQVSSIKPFKSYKVFLSQTAGSNAYANFYIGLGTSEGGYAYTSTNLTLGNTKNGKYEEVLNASEKIPEAGGAYFTFRNTSNNTANSGSDPVVQIDWIGLVASDAFAMTGATSAKYLNGTAYAPLSSKDVYDAAKAEAHTVYNENLTIGGVESTTLNTLLTADEPTTAAGYRTATEELGEALAAFNFRIAAYATKATAVANITSVIESTNVYTTAAYNEYKALVDGYNDKTLTTAEVQAILDPKTTTDYRLSQPAVSKFLLSAWDSDLDDWEGMHVNTWSNSGDFPGDFAVPLVEYWVASGTLSAKTMTATVSGLENNANYKVSADMFVKSSATPTGVSLKVGSATAATITGEADGNFFVSEATAYGVATAEGTLTIQLIVAAGTNANWIGFQNLQYEKVNVDYSELNAAIIAATATNTKIDGGVKSLTDGIAAAEALLSSIEQDEIDAGVTTLNSLTTTAESIIVARKNLAGVAKKANALKSFIDDDIAAEVTTAAAYAANGEATEEEATSKANALNAYFAEWKVVALNNGGFDINPNNTLNGTETVYGGSLSSATANPDNTKNMSENTGDHAYLYEVNGWTQYSKFNSTASQGTTSEYGTAMPANGWSTNVTTPPAADMYGNTSGAALHLSAGWEDQARYQQNISLPAGKYVFYYEAYNAHTVASITSNYFGVNNLNAGDLDGTNNTFKYSNTKSYTSNAWTADAFDFTLNNSLASIPVNVGVTSATNGSGNGAKLWIDNVTIYQLSLSSITKTSSENLEGYKTFYNEDVNYEVDENTTIYVAEAPSEDAKYVTINAVEGTKIVPKKTPVILKTEAEDYTITLTPTAEEGTGDFETNALKVATEEGVVDNAYVLGYLAGDGNGLGFYRYEVALDKGDVYLPISSANSANLRFGIVADGEATGIAGVNAEADKANDATYNLAGQRVGNGYKGIVIKNGKKYMIK